MDLTPTQEQQCEAIALALHNSVLNECTFCWLWKGRTTSKGYPILYNPDTQKDTILTRIILGILDRKDLDASHRCDVPRCVNPLHLKAIPHRENVHDMALKYRHPSFRAESPADLSETPTCPRCGKPSRWRPNGHTRGRTRVCGPCNVKKMQKWRDNHQKAAPAKIPEEDAKEA